MWGGKRGGFHRSVSTKLTWLASLTWAFALSGLVGAKTEVSAQVPGCRPCAISNDCDCCAGYVMVTCNAPTCLNATECSARLGTDRYYDCQRLDGSDFNCHFEPYPIDDNVCDFYSNCVPIDGCNVDRRGLVVHEPHEIAPGVFEVTWDDPEDLEEATWVSVEERGTGRWTVLTPGNGPGQARIDTVNDRAVFALPARYGADLLTPERDWIVNIREWDFGCGGDAASPYSNTIETAMVPRVDGLPYFNHDGPQIRLSDDVIPIEISEELFDTAVMGLYYHNAFHRDLPLQMPLGYSVNISLASLTVTGSSVQLSLGVAVNGSVNNGATPIAELMFSDTLLFTANVVLDRLFFQVGDAAFDPAAHVPPLVRGILIGLVRSQLDGLTIPEVRAALAAPIVQSGTLALVHAAAYLDLPDIDLTATGINVGLTGHAVVDIESDSLGAQQVDLDIPLSVTFVPQIEGRSLFLNLAALRYDGEVIALPRPLWTTILTAILDLTEVNLSRFEVTDNLMVDHQRPTEAAWWYVTAYPSNIELREGSLVVHTRLMHAAMPPLIHRLGCNQIWSNVAFTYALERGLSVPRRQVCNAFGCSVDSYDMVGLTEDDEGYWVLTNEPNSTTHRWSAVFSPSDPQYTSCRALVSVNGYFMGDGEWYHR